jgi:protein TonB
MNTIRFSLITEREALDLPREAGALLLCLLIAAWLHLVFFIAWETMAEGGAGFLRIALPAAPPAPLEIVLTLEAEEERPEIEPQVVEQPAPVVLAAPAEAEAPALEIDPALARVRLQPEAEEEAANPSPPVTVESEAPRFKSYNTAVRGAVAAKWLVPPEARVNFHPGRLVVNCTVGRDGNLIRFVVEESTGNAILDHAGLEALRSAAPFPPFPPEVAAFSQLDLTLIFDYQARYLGRGNQPREKKRRK